jgi:O-antigen ligase
MNWRAVAAVTLVLAAVAVPFTAVVRDRVESEQATLAEDDRTALNHLALMIIADHPLLGVGANNFGHAMQPYLAHNYSADFLYSVHNAYLLIWSETGIGGIVAYVWFLLATMSQARIVCRAGDRLFGTLALGCLGAVNGVSAQMMVEGFRDEPAKNTLWLLAGLLVAMTRFSRNVPALSLPALPASRQCAEAVK